MVVLSKFLARQRVATVFPFRGWGPVPGPKPDFTFRTSDWQFMLQSDRSDYKLQDLDCKYEDNYQTYIMQTIVPNIPQRINTLRKYQDNGYVFHGTPSPDITLITPRYTENATHSENDDFNIDHAVFATPYFTAAIIFACKSPRHIPPYLQNGTVTVGSDQSYGKGIYAEIPKVWKPYITQNNGWVYVLKPDTFIPATEGSWQIKSYDPQTPIDKVEVKFEDFEKTGGKIIWI